MPPDGFRLVSQVLDTDLIASLRECPFGHGQRDILRREPQIAALVRLPVVQDLVSSALSSSARPISGIWFDKAPGANWWVPWHRDEHIPTTPFVAPGWGPWRDKDGVPHVVCPDPWRSRRVALRFHLDDADATQGALEVAPGSHRTTAMEPGGPTVMVEVRAGRCAGDASAASAPIPARPDAPASPGDPSRMVRSPIAGRGPLGGILT